MDLTKKSSVGNAIMYERMRPANCGMAITTKCHRCGLSRNNPKHKRTCKYNNGAKYD